MKTQKKHVANEATPEAAAVKTAAQNIETETVNENGTPETTPTAAAEHTPEAETPTAPETQNTTPTAAAEQVPTQAAATQTTPPQPQRAETFEEIQKRLEIELARLNQKKRLAQHRETFINSMGSLQIYIDALQNENEIETKSGKITFKILEREAYNGNASFTDYFSITNTDLIHKFCKMLYNEMSEKKAELEKQLLTA